MVTGRLTPNKAFAQCLVNQRNSFLKVLVDPNYLKEFKLDLVPLILAI